MLASTSERYCPRSACETLLCYFIKALQHGEFKLARASGRLSASGSNAAEGTMIAWGIFSPPVPRVLMFQVLLLPGLQRLSVIVSELVLAAALLRLTRCDC